MSTLSERIRELRGNISQQDFADTLSISRQYVALLESGKREPSPVLMDAFCHKFGIRREWLETGAEPMYPEQVDDGPHALVPDLVDVLSDHPAVLAALRRVVRIMTPADWDRLNEIIDAVMEEQEKNTPEA